MSTTRDIYSSNYSLPGFSKSSIVDIFQKSVIKCSQITIDELALKKLLELMMFICILHKRLFILKVNIQAFDEFK